MKPNSIITVTANGKACKVPSQCPLPDFLAGMNLAPGRVVVERNGQALTPSESRETLLAEGDRLEIVRLVPGG